MDAIVLVARRTMTLAQHLTTLINLLHLFHFVKTLKTKSWATKMISVNHGNVVEDAAEDAAKAVAKAVGKAKEKVKAKAKVVKVAKFVTTGSRIIAQEEKIVVLHILTKVLQALESILKESRTSRQKMLKMVKEQLQFSLLLVPTVTRS